MSADLSRRDVLRLGAAAAGALAIAACRAGGPAATRPSAGPPDTSDFRIGTLLPAGGPGDSSLRGLRLGLARAGGRAGGRRIVSAAAEEPVGDPVGAVAGARQLVEHDHADLVAGLVGSTNALAVRDYVHARRVPALVMHAGANALSRSLRSPFVYRTSASNWQVAEPIGGQLVGRGVRRLVLVCPQGPDGVETAEALKETFTGEVLAEVWPPSPNPTGDYAAAIAQVNGVRPDAVFVALAGTDAVAFLRQATAQLDPAVVVAGPGLLVEQDVLASLDGAAPVGTLTGLHWTLALGSAANRAFAADFASAFGGPPDVYAVQGFDTARVIVQALDAVRGDTSDSARFLGAIAAARFDSPRGAFRFDPASNGVVNTLYLRELVADPSGGLTNRVVGEVPNVADPGR